MDTNALEQFCQQLGQWIGQRLEAGAFPFRRVEATGCRSGAGQEPPALVLWINRDSLLAGGLILFPAKVDSEALATGRGMAASYGLGQFVTWGARQVTLWSVAAESCEELHRFTLPGARQIAPADFSTTLDALLSALKASCVSAALPAPELPADYFVRLCTLVIKDLQPELNDAALQAAGANRPDSWTATAPRGKAWLSLWRLLMVLWHDRLVPGIQPERLEQAMAYALADSCPESGGLLLPSADEPPLGESAAVRFHQLGGRLRQLGWHSDRSRTQRIVELLLRQAATDLGLPEPGLPWSTDPVDLTINLQTSPDQSTAGCIAPRSYLAGRFLRHHLDTEATPPPLLAEEVADLPGDWSGQGVIANLQDQRAPARPEQERLLLELRKVWPNRRFQLPRQTPRWIWETLYLSGLGTGSRALHLCLPGDWVESPGLDQCWELLISHYRIERFGRRSDGACLLHLAPRLTAPLQIELHRPDGRFLLAADRFENPAPGFLQLCIQAPMAILELILKTELRPVEETGSAWTSDLEPAIYLFSRTSLGQALWRLINKQAPLPSLAGLRQALRDGLPLPSSSRLAALAEIDWRPGQTVPATATLDRKLALAAGLESSPEAQACMQPPARTKRATSTNDLRKEILARVFRDGIPLFPEHYLMAHYRPQLEEHLLTGPLRQTGVFFDRIELCAPDGPPLQVRGAGTAEALILISQTGRTKVSLPADPELTAQLLESYQQDLHQLWDRLVRECRRQLPRQQAALTLARRLWREQGLPPMGTQAG